jgi:hypothetical protein
MLVAKFMDKGYEYGIVGPNHVAIGRRHGADALQHDKEANDGNR